MKLFTQIWNERKHNTGIWLEMLVVSVILWFVIDMLYVRLSIYLEPKGYDAENVYIMDFQVLSKECPQYKDPENGGMSNGKAILEIISRLRNHPDIEDVSISFLSLPYVGGNMARYCTCDSFGDVFQNRLVSADFAKVLKLKGTHGETPEELADILRENKLLVSQFYHPEVDLYHKRLQGITNDSLGLEVGAIIEITKDFETSIPWKDAVYQCYTEQDIVNQYNPDMMTFVNVRVKEGTDKDFDKKIFAAAATQYQVGNLLMTDIISMDKARQISTKMGISQFFIRVGLAVFLLINIFFGILGTFWFRTQQRRHEIALLRAIGSSQKHIYGQIISEGLILLMAGSICAWVIDYFIADAGLSTELYGETLSTGRFVFTAGMSLICMAIMVIIGVIIPARKAQKIEISTALHED